MEMLGGKMNITSVKLRLAITLLFLTSLRVSELLNELKKFLFNKKTFGINTNLCDKHKGCGQRVI
jgi:hypothetical protein